MNRSNESLKSGDWRNFTGTFRYGKSILEPSLEKEGGLNGEIEIPYTFALGATYRNQFSKFRDTERIVFNMGYRVMLFYARYWGSRAFDDPNYYTYSRIEDFSINMGGLESGLYFELGRKPAAKPGIFLNFEPLYARITTDGFGIGIIKTSLKLTL